MTEKDSRPGHHRAADNELLRRGFSDEHTSRPPWLEPHDCPESQLLRAIADNEIPLPGTPLWQVLNGLIERAAVARLRQVSHAIAGEPYDPRDSSTAHWHKVAARRDILARRPITSVKPCHVCGIPVEILHPISEENYALLPDLSWVRCPEHAGVAA